MKSALEIVARMVGLANDLQNPYHFLLIFLAALVVFSVPFALYQLVF
jgi:hypothetical protein